MSQTKEHALSGIVNSHVTFQSPLKQDKLKEIECKLTTVNQVSRQHGV